MFVSNLLGVPEVQDPCKSDGRSTIYACPDKTDPQILILATPPHKVFIIAIDPSNVPPEYREMPTQALLPVTCQAKPHQNCAFDKSAVALDDGSVRKLSVKIFEQIRGNCRVENHTGLILR